MSNSNLYGGRTISDTIHLLVSEDSMFMVVSPELRLLKEGRRKTVCVGLVVYVVVVDVVVDLSNET